MPKLKAILMAKGGLSLLAAVADAGADSNKLDIKGITRAVLEVCCVKGQGVSTNAADADQLMRRDAAASPGPRCRVCHARAAEMLLMA